jgi:hypothetical protein
MFISGLHFFYPGAGGGGGGGPDPGVKNAPDPGSGSTVLGYENNHVFLLLTIEEARHYDGVKVAAAEEPGQPGVRHTGSGQHNAFQPTRR